MNRYHHYFYCSEKLSVSEKLMNIDVPFIRPAVESSVLTFFGWRNFDRADSRLEEHSEGDDRPGSSMSSACFFTAPDCIVRYKTSDDMKYVFKTDSAEEKVVSHLDADNVGLDDFPDATEEAIANHERAVPLALIVQNIKEAEALKREQSGERLFDPMH